jgi:hypothetical protein
MKKFRLISALLLVAAVPVLFSCSKKSSSGEDETIESFNTIGATLFYANSAVLPEILYMGVGESVEIYVGNGSTKAPFNGVVKWTATGAGELAMSAVQRLAASGKAPATKAGYDYNTYSATTNANYNLKITAKSEGSMALTAKDPIGSTKNIMIVIFPDNE